MTQSKTEKNRLAVQNSAAVVSNRKINQKYNKIKK